MNTYFDIDPGRGRFRDHSAFWIAFFAIVVVSMVVVATVFATIGLPAAAGLIATEIALAMYTAIR